MIELTPLSLFRDWYIFYLAGKVTLQGQSPYIVEGFFNPLPTAWLLSITTIIPFPIWAWVMIALSFGLWVALLKRRSHWLLLSLPYIFGMTMGSLDAFLWVPARLFGGVGLSLLTLKPQIGLLWIPIQLREWVLEKDYKQIKLFTVSTLLLWGIPTLFAPKWLYQWLEALPPITNRMVGAASLAGFYELTGHALPYLLVFGVVLIWLILKRPAKDFFIAAMVSPSIWPSDWVIVAEFVSWRFTVLSWLLIFTGLTPNGAQFFWLLGILIWLERKRGQELTSKPETHAA